MAYLRSGAEDPVKFTIVVPVKDEDHETVRRIVSDTQTFFKSKVSLIIVDDGSRIPNPYATCTHSVSLGYGKALKSGILNAKTPWVITMDGDGQHRIRDVARLMEFAEDFPDVEMVIGDRRVSERTWARYLGRKGLNMFASLFAWRWIPDLNSGLRMFKREAALSYEPILCNTFSFTTSLTMSFLADNRKVDWIPVKVSDRPFGKSKVKVLHDGWVTLKYIFWIGLALRTRGIRAIYRRIVHGRS